MFHLDNNSGIDVMPKQKQTISRQQKWFTEGDTQTPPSYPGADWFNIVQAELLNVLKDGDITPSKSELSQLSAAIKSIINKNQIKINDASLITKGVVNLNSAINSTSETEAATPLAVKKAYDLANEAVKKTGDTMSGQLILSEYGIKHMYTDSENMMVSRTKGDNYAHIFYDAEKKQWQDKLIYNSTTNSWSFQYINDVVINGKSVLNNYIPVGVPLAWPKMTPPSGWFECNGSTFDKNKFPKLADTYPSGKLPDLRGVFIRGLDTGSGLDPNRGILSYQGDAIRNIWGEISPISESFAANPTSTGAFRYFEKHADHTPSHIDVGSVGGVTFDASRIVPVANENRPRNVAFMYIVKAE